MKSIRRWTIGIISSVDRMISQVENHDALVRSAIKDVSDTAARAKVQLSRVQRDGHEMRRRLNEYREQEAQWRERALSSAKLDEARALECIKRAKRLTRQIQSLEADERAHSKSEMQLQEDLKKISERLLKLKEQRNLMRTRQSRAQALQQVQGDDTHIISDLEEIFDRWETKVAEIEAHGDTFVIEEDSLESQYRTEEEEKELKEELAQLLAEECGNR